MKDVLSLDATAQAELVRGGQLSCLDLVEAAIARAEAVNPALNAIVTPLYEQAREFATKPLSAGPFAGVPFVLKDLAAECAGARFTSCSKLLQDHVAKHDSELVARYKRAGLIIIATSSASEFGILPTAESYLVGPTKNPWNPALSTGGSSGGSAALVAAGVVAMAHATDTGGSIRIPASCCGLFGLKPTRARTPVGPDFGEMIGGLVQQHAVTRSVRDSAALLDATLGSSPGDPYHAQPVRGAFRDEIESEPGRLRIGFTSLPASGVAIHEDCRAALLDAAKLCEALGHDVAEATLVIDNPDRLSSAFVTLFAAGVAHEIDWWARVTGQKCSKELVEPLTWAFAQLGWQSTAADYVDATHVLHRVGRQVAGFFRDYDVLLTPTLAEPPPPLGTFESTKEAPLMGLFRAGAFTPFTPLANIAGHPAMSVPLYVNAGGLPIGVQFAADFGNEATLFRLAAQLERARPWAARWPSVSAGS